MSNALSPTLALREAREGLAALVRNGSITLEGGEYYGVASDGIKVGFGHESLPLSVWEYLITHPNPSQW